LADSARQALRGLRFLVAALLFIHGAFRVLSGGVTGFGEFLASVPIPAAGAVAWGITILELVGTAALALGWAVRPLALYFAAELVVGIALVHAREGWFVVGGGRNGMEYSVALIGLLLAQAWASSGSERVEA
jgi:putative oxidoreductase